MWDTLTTLSKLQTLLSTLRHSVVQTRVPKDEDIGGILSLTSGMH